MEEGTMPPTLKARRGFSAMSKEKQRAIAAAGGRAAHAKGVGHEWTSEQAREAGRKGGTISQGGKGRRWNREEAVAAARKSHGTQPTAHASDPNSAT